MKKKERFYFFWLIYKRLKISLNYYLRRFFRNILSKLPFILFIISFFLFLMVLIPNMILHRLPIIGEWPKVLEIQGRVLIKSQDKKIAKFVPFSKANIEVGGYKTITDKEGNFILKFVSKKSIDIPMIIQKGNSVIIERISFNDKILLKRKVIKIE